MYLIVCFRTLAVSGDTGLLQVSFGEVPAQCLLEDFDSSQLDNLPCLSPLQQILYYYVEANLKRKSMVAVEELNCTL